MYKIMVVDDDPISLSICKALLGREYDVVLMKSSLHALGYLKGFSPPDVILLDMMMPGMDGVGMLANLREDPTTCDIPVLFMTGLEFDLLNWDVFADGLVDFIQKPIVAKIINMKIRQQIYLGELRRENHMLKGKLDQIKNIL